jgi:hypothetical protein
MLAVSMGHKALSSIFHSNFCPIKSRDRQSAAQLTEKNADAEVGKKSGWKK